MTGAGELRRRVTFQRRAADANGDTLGAWVDIVTRHARIIPKIGGEAVVAQRLEGSQPVVIIVRCGSLTRAIDNACRAFDAEEVAGLMRAGAARAPAVEAATIWGVASAIWNQREAKMEFLAVQRRNGSDA